MCIQQNIFFRNIRTKTQRLDTNTEPPSKRWHINITRCTSASFFFLKLYMQNVVLRKIILV